MLPFLLLSSVLIESYGALLTGFDDNPPIVPSGAPELILEKVWSFDFDDPAMQIQWVPGSEQVVTLHKPGTLRLYESIDAADDDYVTLIDMTAEVWSFSDHGAMSFHFHPNFEGAAGVKKLFIIYTGEPKDVSVLPNNEVVTPIRPLAWGTGPPDDTGYSWYDVCPCLDCLGTGLNRMGNICEHPYYIDRLVLDLDAPIPFATKELTLLEGACGSSSTHALGTLIEVDGDLIFSSGDGSQYIEFDPGFEETDGCYVPGAGLDQGVFRSQRLDFPNGKITRIPGNLLDSDVPLNYEQLTYIARGLRNPFRIFYHDATDTLYVGDVGDGDGGTSERIFTAGGIGVPGLPAPETLNFGWPCVEGIYPTAAAILTGEFAVLDSDNENARKQYLIDNMLDTCDGVYAAAFEYIGQPLVGGAVPDPTWAPPLYEYRVGVLDPDYPTECTVVTGAISSVYIYDGKFLPDDFTGKLMFSDHTKQCLFYFDAGPDGEPDTKTPPHVLLSNSAFIYMTTGPDGYLYGVDRTFVRVVRMSSAASSVPTPAATIAITPAPFEYVGEIKPAVVCTDAKSAPELEWTRLPDGSYTGDLTLGAVTIEANGGMMRTRAWNGMIPGPIIRMKACGIYHLNLFNDLADWPIREVDGVNSMHDPTVTNIHLHGLHISGEAPGDDVFAQVQPGTTSEYIYTVPCDHSGGTNWYHPHHHGSTALHTNGGAAGILVVESSAREASNMPLEIQALPEQTLVLHQVDPVALTEYAAASKDAVFLTTILTPFVLANGCEIPTLEVEAGQWTRLRILNVGLVYNTLVSIEPSGGAAACDVGLLAKDGVWLAEVPRILPDQKLFFSLSSRVDVALRCYEGTHSFVQSNINDPTVVGLQRIQVALLEVVPSLRTVAADLPVWEPCRPAYLMDLTEIPVADQADQFSLEIRNNLNGEMFEGEDKYLLEMPIGMTQTWTVAGADLHPLHLHVNHMQLDAATSDLNQWEEVPGWNVAGDWVDTLSMPGLSVVRVCPERFIGRMVMHCHVAQHSDTGVIAVADISGEGDGGGGSPEIVNFGTCPEEIPVSTPYNKTPITLPGLLEMEYFDEGGEGVGYHNINAATNQGPALRATEAVELRQDGKAVVLSNIRNGEWLRYSVDVQAAGTYNTALIASEDSVPALLYATMWIDTLDCPPPNQDLGLLGAVNEIIDTYTMNLPDQVAIPAGEHSILICFHADTTLLLDSISFADCAEGECGTESGLVLDAAAAAAANNDASSAPQTVLSV